MVPSWKKGNDSSGGEDTGKYKDWLPKCILANRANKRLEVFYNINGKRKKHFRTATVMLPISSGEDLEEHQAICKRSPSGESSFSYEIYLLIMSYISPPVTPVVNKKDTLWCLLVSYCEEQHPPAGKYDFFQASRIQNWMMMMIMAKQVIRNPASEAVFFIRLYSNRHSWVSIDNIDHF